MYTYKILVIYFSSNVFWRKVFFTKLYDAPVGSYVRVCLKNCRKMLDEKKRGMIL
jgi:hypothetical protein